MVFRGILGSQGTVLDKATIDLGVDTSRLRAGMRGATSEIEHATGGWSKAFKVAGVASIALATALTGFAAAGVKASTDLNNALGKVYSMTGASREEITKFREEILKLAPAVGQSPAELAEALYFVKSAGIEGAAAMKVVEMSAKAAAVGMTDVQTVADGVTSVLNAYGLKAEKAGEVTDIMTQTIKSGKFEWAELARSIGLISVRAHSAGIDFKELATMMATLSQAGLTGQRAAFTLESAIRSLNTPSDAQVKVFKQLGIQYDENTLKTKGFVGTLNYLKDGLEKAGMIIEHNTDGTINYKKSLETTEKVLGNSNVAWRKLIGTQGAVLTASLLLTDESARYNKIAAQMVDVNGATEKSFQQMREMNMGQLWKEMTARITVMSIAMAEELLPLVGQFLQFMSTGVPAAMEVLGGLWTKFLKVPITHLIDALSELGTLLGDILFGWSENKHGAKDFGGALDVIAGSLGTIIDYLATMVGWVTKLLDNEIIRNLAQMAVSFGAIALAVSGIRAGAGALGRLMGSTGRIFSSPFTSKPRLVDPAAQAMEGAATAHQRAAGALTDAAGALMRSARTGSVTGTGRMTPLFGPDGTPIGLKGPSGRQMTLKQYNEMRAANRAALSASQELNQAWYTAPAGGATYRPRERGFENKISPGKFLVPDGVKKNRWVSDRAFEDSLKRWGPNVMGPALARKAGMTAIGFIDPTKIVSAKVAPPDTIRTLQEPGPGWVPRTGYTGPEVYEPYMRPFQRTGPKVPSMQWIGSDAERQQQMSRYLSGAGGLRSIGAATPLAFNEEWTKRRPELEKMSTAVRNRFASMTAAIEESLTAGVTEVTKPTSTFGTKLGRSVATATKAIQNIVSRIPTLGPSVGDIQRAISNPVKSFFKNVNTAAMASLKADPLRAQGAPGEFAKPSLNRYVTSMFSQLRAGLEDSVVRAASTAGRATRALSGMFKPITTQMQNALVNAARVAGQGMRLSRNVSNAITQAPSRLIQSALNRAVQTGQFMQSLTQGRGVAGLANSMTMSLGNSMATAIRAVPKGLSNIRDLNMAAQAAAGNLLRSGAGALVTGMMAGAKGAIKVPGMTLNGFKGAARGLGNLTFGREITVPMVNALQQTLYRNAAGAFTTEAKDAAGNAHAMAEQTMRQGGIRGALSGAMSFVGKAFFPVLLGSMALELASAPIGDYVTDNMNLPHLGEAFKRGFFDGIGALVTTWLQGVDVELASQVAHSEINVAGVKINLADMKRMNFSDAEIVDMTSDDVTLSGKINQLKAAHIQLESGTIPGLHIPDELQVPDLNNLPDPGDLVGIGGELVQAFWDKLSDELFDTELSPITMEVKFKEAAKNLGIDWDKMIQQAMDAGLSGNFITDDPTRQFIFNKMRAVASEQFKNGWADVRLAVRDALEAAGIDPTGVALMSQSDIEVLAALMTNNATGQWDLIIQSMVERAAAGVADHKPKLAVPEFAGPGFEPTAGPADLPSETTDLEQRFKDFQRVQSRFLARPGGEEMAADAADWLATWQGEILKAAKKGKGSTPLRRELIRNLFPKESEDLKGTALDELWPNVMGLLEAQIDATGSGDLISVARAFGNVAADWARSGMDFAKNPIGASILATLDDAITSGIASPELIKAYNLLLEGSFTLEGANAIKAARKSISTMLFEGLIPGITDGQPRMTKALRDALSTALRESATETYPNAAAAGKDLLRLFIDEIPASQGKLKRVLQRTYVTALKEANDSAHPGTKKWSHAFLQAFIDSLPDRYASLKRTLTNLLKTGATESGQDKGVNRAARGIGNRIVGSVNESIDTPPHVTEIGNSLSDVVLGGIETVNPAANGPMWARLNEIGINAVNGIAAGIKSSTAISLVSQAVHTTLDSGFTPNFPNSPSAKQGPLKGNYLHNVGQTMMEHISEGMHGFDFGVPQMNLAAMNASGGSASGGAGGGHERAGQSVYIDRMTINRERDEQSAVRRLQFLMGGERN